MRRREGAEKETTERGRQATLCTFYYEKDE